MLRAILLITAIVMISQQPGPWWLYAIGGSSAMLYTMLGERRRNA